MYACMKFYNGTRPLYLETDATGAGLELDYYRPETEQRAHKTEHLTTVF